MTPEQYKAQTEARQSSNKIAKLPTHKSITAAELIAGGMSRPEVRELLKIKESQVAGAIKRNRNPELTATKIKNLIQLRNRMAVRALEDTISHGNAALAEAFALAPTTISKIASGSSQAASPDDIKEIKRRSAIRKRAEQVYNRHCKNRLMEQFGRAAVERALGEKVRGEPKPKWRWPGTPMGKFAVMKLTQNPADVRTYY